MYAKIETPWYFFIHVTNYYKQCYYGAKYRGCTCHQRINIEPNLEDTFANSSFILYNLYKYIHQVIY